MKTKIALLVALVMLTSAFTYSPWDDNSDEYIKDVQTISEDLNGIDKVLVKNVNGSIQANIGSANSLEMESNERVKIQDKIDARSLIDEVKVVTSRNGNELRVYLDYGRYKDDKDRQYYNSSFELRLPARLSVHFESTNGSITAPAFDGEVMLETTNGSISSEGAGRGAHLKTTNGKIKIDSVKGDVSAETTNGGISISGAAGSVNAETTNGDIKVDLKAALAGDIDCETTNGSITFKVPAGSGYSLEADTSWGKVHAGDGLRYNKRRNTASGTVGDGRFKVSLETTNGSIYVK